MDAENKRAAELHSHGISGHNKQNYQYSTTDRENVKPPCDRGEHCRQTPHCRPGCKPPVDIQSIIAGLMQNIGARAK